MSMKRVVSVVATSFVAVLTLAAPALATYPPSPPPTHPPTSAPPTSVAPASVAPTSVAPTSMSVAPKVITHSPREVATRSPVGGIAFTGANIAVALLVALALAVVGTGLLWGARRLRRDASTTGGPS